MSSTLTALIKELSRKGLTWWGNDYVHFFITCIGQIKPHENYIYAKDYIFIKFEMDCIQKQDLENML